MIGHVALLLAILLVAAKIGGEIATRLRQPAVLGELLAGMLVGNVKLPLLAGLGEDPSFDLLSQIGALLLMFEVGLESTVREVAAVGIGATRVAVLGTVASFAAGYLAARLCLPHAPAPAHAFLAASITATSVGISARVCKDLGAMRSIEARTILGAAVLDDILGLLVLAVVSGWIVRGGAGPADLGAIAWIVVKTVLLLAIAIYVGVRLAPRVFRLAARLRTEGVLLAVGLAFCFFGAWGSTVIGLAPIVGAFAAGLVLEELHSAEFVARGERSLSQLVEPISGFLVPLFFVIMGVRADVHAFARLDTVLLALVLTLAAVAGKLACAAGPTKPMSRLAVAFGMVPRGEVTLVFAGLGSTLTVDGAPVLGPSGYSALVCVVLLTTFAAPPALKWSFARRRPEVAT